MAVQSLFVELFPKSIDDMGYNLYNNGREDEWYDAQN